MTANDRLGASPELSPARRVLLLVPTNTYRAGDFLAAARRLDVDVTVGTDEKQALEDLVPGTSLWLEFNDSGSALERITRFAERFPIDAVIGADDETTVLAAEAARSLDLPHNPPDAVRTTRSKHALRETLAAAGLPSPGYRLVSRNDDPRTLAHRLDYPCVLKPTFLSASRGVIRVDDGDAFVRAFRRIGAILDEPDVANAGGEEAGRILVEDYVPGSEYALEGMLSAGELVVLALFDKPDPLEGPFFEESIYVTPSRADPTTQARIRSIVRSAVDAIGLREGPLHAELRVNDAGAFIVEIAARAIGGLCPRVLRFGTGRSLEELILLHATGHDFAAWERERSAAGVLMLPTPEAGILEGVDGIDPALSIPEIEDVVISINCGQRVVPLPEGHRYLGFVFARGPDPATVEAALRAALRRLEIRIGPMPDAIGTAMEAQ